MKPNNAMRTALERLCIVLFVLACLLGSLTSCHAVRAIPLSRADSTHTAVHARDTIRLIDSITTREYHRHDTVYRTRETIRYRDRISLRTDTIYRTQTVVQTLPPERYIPRFYQVCTALLCLLILCAIAYLIARFYFRR